MHILFIYNNFCIIVVNQKYTMKNKFLIEMQARGYINQCTDLNKLSGKFVIKIQYLPI